MDMYLNSPLTKLGFLCLKNVSESLSSHKLEDFRSTLALVLNGLASQAQNANVTRALLKLIKSSIPRADMQAIQHRENVSTYELDVGEDYVGGETQSSWTPTVVSISDDPKSKELSKLMALTVNDITTAEADRPVS